MRCRSAAVSDTLVVVGGGYIACEMASIFRGLGAQVTQIVRARGSCAASMTTLRPFWRPGEKERLMCA